MGFSNAWIATLILTHIFLSVLLSISLLALLFGPHEIMSNRFFCAGGGELGDSGSASLLLLFDDTFAFRLDFGVSGSSSSSSVSSLVFLVSF